MDLYTTGDVCKKLGIKERVLKYYVESGIIEPTEVGVSGKRKYWYFDEAAINRINQIRLYKELGYSADEIKDFISQPVFDWKKALGKQINELKEKKKHYENLILTAETMRYFYESGLYDGEIVDISVFGNDLDNFALSAFSSSDNSKEGLLTINQDISGGMEIAEINKVGTDVMEMLAKISYCKNMDPESSEVQKVVSDVFDYIVKMSGIEAIDAKDVLYGIRLTSNFSLESLIDSMLGIGTTDFVLKALEKYSYGREEI